MISYSQTNQLIEGHLLSTSLFRLASCLSPLACPTATCMSQDVLHTPFTVCETCNTAMPYGPYDTRWCLPFTHLCYWNSNVSFDTEP